jgi:acetoacetyl-CoA reductase
MTSRVALVTGGTGGIGTAICKRLAQQGLRVATNFRNEAKAREWQSAMKEQGFDFALAKGDVGNPEEAAAMVREVESQLGPIDVLINNAGITRDGTLMRMSREDWQSVIDTNLGACFNMCKAVFPGMRERGFGRIVNIGSINGQAGQYGQVNYAAAKSGIHGFTKALAMECAAQGITVNAIAPGYVDTDMVRAVPENILEKIIARIPMGRLGRAHDIARAVCFLCSDDGDFVTGSTLSINGGQHMY